MDVSDMDKMERQFDFRKPRFDENFEVSSY